METAESEIAGDVFYDIAFGKIHIISIRAGCPVE